jgi:hypothetical protein
VDHVRPADELVHFGIRSIAQLVDVPLTALDDLCHPVPRAGTDVPHGLEASHLVQYGRLALEQVLVQRMEQRILRLQVCVQRSEVVRELRVQRAAEVEQLWICRPRRGGRAGRPAG